MKRLTVVLLVTLAVLLAVPSAQAAQPTIERIPINVQFIDEESCDFRVETQITGFAVVIEWADADGRILFFEVDPQLRLILTNLDTGETITVNVSGPVHVNATADGGLVVLETGLWGRTENPETGEPGLFQSAGLLRITIDAEGNESVEFVGRVTDLCAELAA